MKLQSIPGDPIWQFHRGRAVIVAAHHSGIKEDLCDQNKHYLTFGARVATEIDWIDSVINPKEKPYKDLYLVNTDSCRIIRWPTWDPEILPYYKKVWNYNKSIDCEEPTDITIERINFTGIIVKNPLNKNIKCFVKLIYRKRGDSGIYYSYDFGINLNEVNYFGYKTLNIRCEGERQLPLLFKNLASYRRHIFTGESKIEKVINLVPNLKPTYPNNTIKPTKPEPGKPNILILGIDSISFLNFERHLPLTKEFLRKHNFYTMYGYNKVGLNKFPNLIPLLTGHYVEELWDKNEYDFDNWPFIWRVSNILNLLLCISILSVSEIIT